MLVVEVMAKPQTISLTWMYASSTQRLRCIVALLDMADPTCTELLLSRIIELQYQWDIW